MNPKPSAADQEHLAAKSGMSKRQIEVWFQNRRRRTKAQHAEKGEKYHPQRSSGFADENIEKLRTGLPSYLLQAEGASTVELAEKVASADLEREERDFRPESKHASFHTPRYTRTTDSTENPLNPSSAPLPAPFKPQRRTPHIRTIPPPNHPPTSPPTRLGPPTLHPHPTTPPEKTQETPWPRRSTRQSQPTPHSSTTTGQLGPRRGTHQTIRHAIPHRPPRRSRAVFVLLERCRT
ncbi:hypothetical protein PM082_003169 [Marasmius tenuissimus]|nr:hypothetical protein PM082_003169 [Marasmius tenuissimus]